MKLSNEELGLRKEILEREFGLSVITLTPFDRGVMNENILVESKEGRFVLKRYAYKTSEIVEGEISVLLALRDLAFPAPRVREAKDGKNIIEVDGKPAILYHFISGETGVPLTEPLLVQTGRRMAEMHVYLDPALVRSRPSWDPEPLYALFLSRGKELKERNFPGADALLALLEGELPRYTFPANLPGGFTHQDLKPENIVVQGGALMGVLDFDNSYVGTFLHDLTTTIIWSCFEEGSLNENKVNALLGGYEEIRALSAEEKDNVQGAIKWRLLREIFIGPLVTSEFPELSRERADYFLSLYRNLHLK